MSITVIQNAYLRLAEQNPNFSEIHKKLMLFLLHERKHYTLQELLCFANYCEDRLVSAISDLESEGLIRKEGWLVSLADQSALENRVFASNFNTQKTPILSSLKTSSGKRKGASFSTRKLL